MNDHHMISLANIITAERRAEADRQRIAHAAQAGAQASARSRTGTSRPRLTRRPILGSLLGRIAHS